MCLTVVCYNYYWYCELWLIIYEVDTFITLIVCYTCSIFIAFYVIRHFIISSYVFIYFVGKYISVFINSIFITDKQIGQKDYHIIFARENVLRWRVEYLT